MTNSLIMNIVDAASCWNGKYIQSLNYKTGIFFFFVSFSHIWSEHLRCWKSDYHKIKWMIIVSNYLTANRVHTLYALIFFEQLKLITWHCWAYVDECFYDDRTKTIHRWKNSVISFFFSAVFSFRNCSYSFILMNSRGSWMCIYEPFMNTGLNVCC